MTDTRPARAAHEIALPAVFLAVFAWGTGPLLVKAMSIDGYAMAFYRMWLATPVMWLAARVWGQPVTWPILRKCIVPGLFFGLSMTLGYEAARTTSIASATLIGNLNPALMILGLGRLVGERSNLRRLPFAVVAFGGLALVVLAGSSTDGASVHGDVLALLNLCCWSVYFIILKKTRDAGVDGWTFLFGVFLFGAITISPWCIAVSRNMSDANGKDFALIGLMILGPGLVGHGLVTWSSRHLAATTISLITLLGPVVSVIGAWIFYDQSLGWAKVIGAVLVIAGLAGTVWRGTSVGEPGV